MDRITLRPATPDDVRAFHPEGLPRTVRAWVVVVDGQPQCLAGVTIAGEHVIVFSEIADKASLPKLTIWRGSKLVMQRVAAMGLPVVAVEEDGSGAFLKRLGFVPTADEGVYAWAN